MGGAADAHTRDIADVLQAYVDHGHVVQEPDMIRVSRDDVIEARDALVSLREENERLRKEVEDAWRQGYDEARHGGRTEGT